MLLKKLTINHADIEHVKKVFLDSFPENERPMDIDTILAQDEIPFDLIGIYPDEAPDDFVGFFLTVKNDECAYLVYFAISPEKRSGGIGSKAIQALKEQYKDTPLLFSYESIYQESNNAKQREKRRNFYLKNGFYETGWFANLAGTEFILASSVEEFHKDSFLAFLTTMAGGRTIPELYRRDI